MTGVPFRDAMAMLEGLWRVDACMPPRVPVPQPGPCPGSGLGRARTAVRKIAGRRVTRRDSVSRSAPDSVYTGPAVTFTAADRGAIEQFKQWRRIERSGSWQQQVHAREQMERARTTMTALMRARAVQEGRIEDAIERFADGQPVEQVKRRMTRELEKIFSGKKIATRMTEEGLLAALRDGRFKTQFETGASGLMGAYVPDERAAVEERLFGIARNGFDASRRPYYGYVLTSGVNASPADDAILNAYGPVQVVFKDQVRARTTAMIGDSINDEDRGRPSPVNAPQFWSFKPSRLRPGDYDHEVTGPVFRGGEYAEAQIHDGVDVDDIEEVTFASPPSPTLSQAMDAYGVRWRVIAPQTERDR